MAGIGRFGPYLQHDGKYKSIPKDDDVLTIGLNRAVDLLAQESKGRGRDAPRPASRRQSSGRQPAGHAARRPLRPLREVGQGQRHHPEGHRAGVR